MIKPILVILIAWVLISAMLLSSCAGGTEDILTLTFSPRSCSYEASKVLDPVLTIDWVIKDDTVQEYVYILLTLDEKKTKTDLQEWLADTTDHPSWATILSFDIAGEGGQTITRELDLSANASFDGDPVYIVCSIGEQLFVEGPIKIKD